MGNYRLDQAVVRAGLAETRSQASNFIKLGLVQLNNKVVQKTGQSVQASDKITLVATEKFVSRAGLKIASVAQHLGIDFRNKVVLDVGSSTGGFTDYALQNGARKVFAVDVGSGQLHQRLRADERVAVHEQTDIRNFTPNEPTDIVVIDVSFISLRDILPHILSISAKDTQIVAMVKPQFEAGRSQVSRGVIKNDKIRRQILNDFEEWARRNFLIQKKRDSDIAGQKGNVERFYLLAPLKH